MSIEQGSGAGRVVTSGDGHDAPEGAAASTLVSLAQRLSRPQSRTGGRDELAEVVAVAQALVNATTAVQDAAIARLAAVEPEWAEDGTIVEVVRPVGHVALDVADIVAPALGASHGQAQRRVDQAVRVAAGRVPLIDTPRGLPQPTGLLGLHAAMAEGRLDGYRAGVLAHELAEVPCDVVEAVVAALDDHLGCEPAPALRRRCRRLLARVSPDLLRRRAERARSETGLRRWVAEPGVDAWWGTFPSEDAAAAWSAIDALARQYVADGVCTGVERARAKALTDLVTGSATVTVSLVLTVPAADASTDAGPAVSVDTRQSDGVPDVAAAEPCTDDLVEVRGLRPSEASFVARRWLSELPATGQGSSSGATGVERTTATCHPGTGALLDATVTAAHRPPERLAATVRARDGRCRFPGCSVAARFCDLDHVRPWPSGPTAVDNLACLCRRHHRIKQRPGWRVRMLAGAVLEWTDPLGRLRATMPVDALHGAVLQRVPDAPTVEPPAADDGHAAELVTEPEFSRLEFALEHLAGVVPPRHRPAAKARSEVDLCRTAERRGLEVDLAALGARRCGAAGFRSRRVAEPQWPDVPPF